MNSAWTESPPPRRPHPLRQALALALLRRPGTPLQRGSLAGYLLACATWLGAGLLLDLVAVERPGEFGGGWALVTHAFPLWLVLAAATLAAAVLQRGEVAPGLATVLLLALLPAALVLGLLGQPLAGATGIGLAAVYLFGLFLQAARWAGPAAGRGRRWSTALAGTVLGLAAWNALPTWPWWWEFEAQDAEEDAAGFVLDTSAEQLWSAQPERLRQALARLAPQRPGTIDLYVLAVAGDASESVFRNEVGFVRRLAEERLDARGRVLSLVNHPDTLEAAPIASVTNLREALAGLARVMDPEEDLLWLFLTSHGSEDHVFYLGLDPLPLDGLDPVTLRALLEEAGLRWKVVVVSSCFSGGFVEPLREPGTLVITAARADRPSFGCGVRSEITWFGEAFLAEALNRTYDFRHAFQLARAAIRAREQAQGETPSEPQIALGEALAARLDAWLAGLPPAPQVPFEPGLELAPR